MRPVKRSQPIKKGYVNVKQGLGGGNSNIFGMFSPKIGEDELPFLTN